jgi:hypothetical protein
MKKNILLPQNLFSKILLAEIKPDENYQIQFLPSSLIAKKIFEDKNTIGIIPSLDVLSYKDIYISSEIGISFNAFLSNSYIYFKEEQTSIEDLFLIGDVSSNEIILSKIIFKELYDVDIIPTLNKGDLKNFNNNILIAGDENYAKEIFQNGLSFAEEIIELIDAPYVNFVLAASSDSVLKEFTNKHRDNLINGHTENYSELLPELSNSSLDFISANVQHLVFDFEDQDLEGIKSLLQIPFLYGIIKDMIDVKFV